MVCATYIIMTPDQQQLWRQVKDFDLDVQGARFSFTDRLARENDWSLAFSLRVVMEYKRFMFLICMADHPLTPSDEVDQAWHLHLLYTESYWKDFCDNTLGRSIHHGPTKGGQSEKEKFNDWYGATKELYQTFFKKEPPADIWPSNKIRFASTNYSRVNRHENWVIPKPRLLRLWKR